MMLVRNKMYLWILMSSLVLGAVSIGTAQSRMIPAVQGSSDRGMAFPHLSKRPGTKDSGAIRAVQNYLASVSPDARDGFCALGTIAIGSDTLLPATLTLDGAGRARLDMSAPSGTRSVRMSGAVGGVIQENGSILRYPAATARAGLFPTPAMLRMELKDFHTTWIDDGDLLIGGIRYESVTYGRPSNPRLHTSSLNPLIVTQLLFDPATHLLLKAVDGVFLSETSRSKHLRVVTYANYEQHDHDLVPANISESRDGQTTFRLALRQVEMGCAKSPDYFALKGGVE